MQHDIDFLIPSHHINIQIHTLNQDFGLLWIPSDSVYVDARPIHIHLWKRCEVKTGWRTMLNIELAIFYSYVCGCMWMHRSLPDCDMKIMIKSSGPVQLHQLYYTSEYSVNHGVQQHLFRMILKATYHYWLIWICFGFRFFSPNWT